MGLLNDTEVGNRLKTFREGQNLSARKFALKAHIDPSQYAKIEKGELPVTQKIINKLGETYALDKEFVKHGMNVPQETLADDQERTYIKKRLEIKNGSVNAKGIPFYDAPAAAGITETEMTAIHAPAGTIDIGDLLSDSQAAIRIYGNSMLPNYPPGCVVGLARCNKSFIEPGEVYVIETMDRRLLKRLFYKADNSDGDWITCYSDNIMKFEGGARDGRLAYPPFDIPKTEIINLFVVTGVIKRNANSVIINR